jgi:hypothetical protein
MMTWEDTGKESSVGEGNVTWLTQEQKLLALVIKMSPLPTREENNQCRYGWWHQTNAAICDNSIGQIASATE